MAYLSRLHLVLVQLLVIRVVVSVSTVIEIPTESFPACFRPCVTLANCDLGKFSCYCGNDGGFAAPLCGFQRCPATDVDFLLGLKSLCPGRMGVSTATATTIPSTTFVSEINAMTTKDLKSMATTGLEQATTSMPRLSGNRIQQTTTQEPTTERTRLLKETKLGIGLGISLGVLLLGLIVGAVYIVGIRRGRDRRRMSRIKDLDIPELPCPPVHEIGGSMIYEMEAKEYPPNVTIRER